MIWAIGLIRRMFANGLATPQEDEIINAFISMAPISNACWYIYIYIYIYTLSSTD